MILRPPKPSGPRHAESAAQLGQHGQGQGQQALTQSMSYAHPHTHDYENMHGALFGKNRMADNPLWKGISTTSPR